MNHAVTFIDVLGFKEMIDSHSSDELGDKYKTAISNALGMNDNGFKNPNEPSFFPSRAKGEQYCNSTVFSDSIILSSHDDSQESVLKLLIFTFLITRMMMVQGFLVRGGVSFGDMFVDLDSNVFVGSALTNAYQLEMKQEWAGVTIDSSIVVSFPSLFDSSHKFGKYLDYLFVKYLVPMKRGEVKEEYTINWRWNLTVEKGTKSLLKASRDWAAKTKIDNTLAYAKFIRLNKLAYPRKKAECPIEVRSLYSAAGEPTGTLPDHGDEY
jgi:hypothetical protein